MRNKTATQIVEEENERWRALEDKPIETICPEYDQDEINLYEVVELKVRVRWISKLEARVSISQESMNHVSGTLRFYTSGFWDGNEDRMMWADKCRLGEEAELQARIEARVRHLQEQRKR
jgi:hypothetical protein